MAANGFYKPAHSLITDGTNKVQEDHAGNRVILPKHHGIQYGNIHDSHRVLKITSAQLLALNATPITVLTAQTGYIYHVHHATVRKEAGTAYTLASNKDITLRYTDGSGAQITTAETTGFLDQTSALMTNFITNGTSVIMPSGAAVVAHMTTGEVTGGTGDIYLTVWFSMIPDAITQLEYSGVY